MDRRRISLARAAAIAGLMLIPPAIGFAGSPLPDIAQSYSAQPYIDGPGAPAFCRAPIPGYCQMVERRLRRDGPFEAAVAKAHEVTATIWFTALPDGQVVAALFRHSSGNMLIDQGLMNALAPLPVPVPSGYPRTFEMPIVLHAINNTPTAASYIRIQPEN